MARQLSEFRRKLRELAATLVAREATHEEVTPTSSGLVRYRQLTSLSAVPNDPVIRELVMRTINQELRVAAIDAAQSVDRRINDIAALVRAAGIDVRTLLEQFLTEQGGK